MLVIEQRRPPKITRYPQSAFWEAKVVKAGKLIGLSRSEYQTQGYLDYLSHYSTAAKATKPRNLHPNGFLIYLNTANVGISQTVLNYDGDTPSVRFTPVAVYQAVACRNPMAQPGILRMGSSILLNGNRLVGYPPTDPTLPAGRSVSVQVKP